MKTETEAGETVRSLRFKLMRTFLWVSIVGWGIGLGAKLFDLLVVARAWGASPPESLALMPYGSRFPMNPGDFFQPLSALMVVGILGALVSGWKTPPNFRVWLWIPVAAFLVIWAITPTIFWPMIRELYGSATGEIAGAKPELVALVSRWYYWDSFRTALIAIGFLSSVKAISMPLIKQVEEKAYVTNTPR
jgi:hypothetical protein